MPIDWQQLLSPDLDIVYTGGWCLKAVEDAFNTAHLYPSATAAWNGNESNHPNEVPPLGVSVPVYFSLGNIPEGHVAISLPDGRVASSTKEGVHRGLFIHPSLANLIAIYAQYNGGCQYLGWAECLAGSRIIEGETEMTNEEHAKQEVRLIADVIGGDPQYEATHPQAFAADVDRILSSTDPLVDRSIGHDFMRDYDWKSPAEAAVLTADALSQIKAELDRADTVISQQSEELVHHTETEVRLTTIAVEQKKELARLQGIIAASNTPPTGNPALHPWQQLVSNLWQRIAGR